jgi:hypothetical protein
MEKIKEYAIFLCLIPAWAVLLYCLVRVNINPPTRHNICTVAEISPDVTPQERERCRMIRGHKL